jgi:hypothetical protein
MVKDLVKPHFKIHINTSKSTFMEVVQLVEGHNFHVD